MTFWLGYCARPTRSHRVQIVPLQRGYQISHELLTGSNSGERVTGGAPITPSLISELHDNIQQHLRPSGDLIFGRVFAWIMSDTADARNEQHRTWTERSQQNRIMAGRSDHVTRRELTQQRLVT